MVTQYQKDVKALKNEVQSVTKILCWGIAETIGGAQKVLGQPVENRGKDSSQARAINLTSRETHQANRAGLW
jgi:hypothetical protein